MVPYFVLVFVTSGTVSFLFPTFLQSCNFVVNLINKSFLLPKTLDRLFDKTVSHKMKLEYNKLPQGVLKAYLPGYFGETITKKTIRYVLTFMKPVLWLFKSLLLLLVNMIPFLGPVLVVMIKAPSSGFNKHRRYFHLKGFSNGQIHYIRLSKAQFYFAFGVVSLSLELIPFANILFTFTNTIGAALWAIEIEKLMAQNLLVSLHRRHIEIDAQLRSDLCLYED